MFNLLKKEDKAAIGSQYKMRLLIVILWFLFVSLCALFLLLFPSYFISNNRQKIVEENYNSLVKTLADQKKGDPGQALNDINQRIILIATQTGGKYIYKIFEDIISKKTSSIILKSFSADNLADGQREITIEGRAKNRQSLSDFSDMLKNQRLFSNIDLPVSNFANDTNIDFTVRMTGTF
ncbi:MAG: PilN domain-containing protein [Candidatus Paceibacterota bacterium]|jgi:hypothetical protein